MGIFGTKEKSPLYHASYGNIESLPYASAEDLQKWANDPNCIEREQCAQVLAKRLAVAEAQRVAREKQLGEKRIALQEDPFDPRTEISADARHIAARIVKNLWIIFVLLPVVVGILIEILK